MIQVEKLTALREQIRAWRDDGDHIVFVPTMGNLHEGHVSLMQKAREHGERVVASIFVNPTQFGENEDFSSYPRTLERDCQQLRRAGVDLVFAPDEKTVYPLGSKNATQIHVPGVTRKFDGKHRPGHFDGVATVVCRLFSMVSPDVALFGQKDYQQLMVIRQMVKDLSMPIRVEHAPTVRAEDGLALSSRNQYLSDDERAVAPLLHAQLEHMREAITAGSDDYKSLQNQAREVLLGAGFNPDYISVRRARDLKKPRANTKSFVIVAAAWLGNARLIDNLLFELN